MIHKKLYKGVKDLSYVQRLFEVIIVLRALEGIIFVNLQSQTRKILLSTYIEIIINHAYHSDQGIYEINH